MKKWYIVVTPFFPSGENWRGAYCLDFVKSLMRILGPEWQVAVFKPEAGPDYECDGVTVHRFATSRLPSGLFPNLFNRRNKASFLRAVSRAGIRIEDVAVCHGHTADCAIYPIAVKDANPDAMALLHHHDPGSVGLRNGRFHGFWIQRASAVLPRRRYFERMDGHVFISRMVERSFRSFPDASWSPYEDYRKCAKGFGWMRPFRIKAAHILHNGVDTAVFNASGRDAVRREPGVFRIGCVANLSDWKDPLTLVRAVAIFAKAAANGDNGGAATRVKLVCIGSGDDVPEMVRIAEESNLDLEIRSEVRHGQLADFYRSLDLFVLPSYFEGFGCVFTEAWACGTPFITCEGQGMDDLIPENERHLWLAKPKDANGLAEKIGYFFRHRPEQHLNEAVGIDGLVSKFVEEIGLGKR